MLAFLIGMIVSYSDQEFSTNFSPFRCTPIFNMAGDVTDRTKYLFAHSADFSRVRVCSDLSLDQWMERLENQGWVECRGDPLECATKNCLSSDSSVRTQMTVQGSSLTTDQVLDLLPNNTGNTGWAWSFDVGFPPRTSFLGPTCDLVGKAGYFDEMRSSIKDWTPCRYDFVFEVQSHFTSVHWFFIMFFWQFFMFLIFICTAHCSWCIDCCKQCDSEYREHPANYRLSLMTQTPFAPLYALKASLYTKEDLALRPLIFSAITDLLVLIASAALQKNCALGFLIPVIVYKSIRLMFHFIFWGVLFFCLFILEFVCDKKSKR